MKLVILALCVHVAAGLQAPWHEPLLRGIKVSALAGVDPRENCGPTRARAEIPESELAALGEQAAKVALTNVFNMWAWLSFAS
jgi:hypothetical protein